MLQHTFWVAHSLQEKIAKIFAAVAAVAAVANW